MAGPTATATPPPAGSLRPDAVSFLPKTRFVRLVAALPKLALRRCASCFLTAVSPPLSPESKNAVQPQTPLATHDHEGKAPEEPEAEQPQYGEHTADADADAAAAAAPEDVGGKHQTRRHIELSLYDGGACMQATPDLEALAVAPKRPVASAEPEEPKKGKRQRAKKAKRTAGAAAPAAVSAKAIAGKYWRHRHSLFSLYDHGVRMDAEGWYSATPEAIAAAQATRAAPADLVVDAFAGVGGNSIQFAARGCYVVAVEIDPRKVELARHNARIYGVEDMIEFVVGDFFQLAPYLKADLVFLSPPWGGPSYNKTPMYTLDMLLPKDGHTLFEAAEKIAPSIIMFLPRNVNMGEVAELGCFSSPPLDFEREVNYLQGRIKGITAYFGNVAQPLVLKPRSGRKC